MDSVPAKTSISERLRAPGAIVAIVVTLLPLLYFFPATRGQLIISPDDGIIQNIPFRAAVAGQIHAGFVPLWNSSLFCGMPLLAAAQAGVLFPLNWFFLVCPISLATNLMMLSTYMIAALGAYLFARRSGSSVAGAGLTSLVWQASAFLVAQIGHTNIAQNAAVLPWLFWALEGYGETSDRRNGALLAAIVAVQCFAGHQQTFAYSLIVAAGYALAMWRIQRARSYLWSLLLILAGLALAAVQIIPTLELLRFSLRSAASYDFFTSFSMPRRFVMTLFAPYVIGGGDGNLFRAPYVGPPFYAEYVAYVGLATLALALLALILKRDGRTIFWTIVTVVGIILALGRYAPLDFNRLIYAVPVLNLFRVPARHLMEVEFALAVLAGRGLTAAMAAPERARTVRSVAVVGAVLVIVTWLAVTVGRPSNFHLARNAPVTILRAPELFLPLAFSVLSAAALWFAVAGRGTVSMVLLLAVVYLDLNLWGQFSGWRTASPTAQSEIWNEPAALKFLRENARPDSAAPYRILTQDHLFDPEQPVSYAAPVEIWLPALQPDIPMMWGWENAAGYEGFGLARYSKLAGDMKVWGDLTDPERTLRGESRELDLLNVRYLLVRSPAAPRTRQTVAAVPEIPATEIYGGEKFAKGQLNLPNLVAKDRITFQVPATETRSFALTSTLAWSETARDGTIVARIRLHTSDGKRFDFELRAGQHTSEWAHDRSDTNARIKHQRAPVATSYVVEDAQPKFEGHDYVAAFELPSPAVIVAGEIMLVPVEEAPRLTLNIGRMSLLNGDAARAIRKEWITLTTSQPQPATLNADAAGPRWKHVVDAGSVSIYENLHVLPRVWLANSERVASGPQQLEIIRTGKISADAKWQPLDEVLVERPAGVAFPKEKPPSGRAEITNRTSNRVEVATDSFAPSLLVLADNYYPGWRAEVDGRAARIMRVNYNQRGVALPAGRHLVTFSYQPGSVLAGLLVSGLSLMLLLVWMNCRPRESLT
jgi:Bacterial membrane protein YfhO